MANFTAGTSFSDGVTNDVTALKLNALVADAVPTSNLALTSTNGTIANFTSSTANITLGTIPTLTAGTTTGTAGIFTSGTITNLSTTLAGDFTISQGTGTLGTTGATLGTYGGVSSVPVLTVDAKGRTTSATSVTNPVGFRNRIINGDMQIDQRNAGSSQSYTSAPARTYCVDRFTIFYTANSKFTTQQNAGSVTPPVGFSKYLGITSSSSYSVLSSDSFLLGQPIEGQSIADLAWGTASAVSVTLSFWVRSSLTGTFGGSINNSDVSRSYPFTYTISSSNTWERKTITISGDTTGTWLTNDGVGLFLWIGLGVGSTASGTAGSWAGADYRSATGAVSVVGTSGATFYITGVQLEAGSTATDFERRPIGTELALCQRYYYRISGINNYQPVGSGTNRSTTTCRISSVVPSPMRTTPTVTLSTGANALLASTPADNGLTTLSNAYGGSNSMMLDASLNSSATTGDAVVVYVGTDNNSFAQFNSEL